MYSENEMGNDSAAWPHLRWIQPDKQRYYQAHVQRDLLGDLIIQQCWGSLNTRQGGQRSHFCATLDEALLYIVKLKKRRQQRGYQMI